MKWMNWNFVRCLRQTWCHALPPPKLITNELFGYYGAYMLYSRSWEAKETRTTRREDRALNPIKGSISLWIFDGRFDMYRMTFVGFFVLFFYFQWFFRQLCLFSTTPSTLNSTKSVLNGAEALFAQWALLTRKTIPKTVRWLYDEHRVSNCNSHGAVDV